MKKSFFILTSLFCGLIAFAQQKEEKTLMTVGGKSVPLSYFEYIYTKNNSNTLAEQKTLTEYLDLFTIFKLKVTDAEVQQMDTLETFKTELAGYRSQLAASYMTDTVARNAMAEQEYNRMKKEVSVSHILLRIGGEQTPADTLATYKKALEIRKRLQKEDFATIAQEVSEDQSVKENKGDLGVIPVLAFIYPFEDAAYSTPEGKITAPVRSQFGYHIIKVNKVKPSRGKVLAAHIMVVASDSLSEAQTDSVIQAVYQKALAGEDFGELAKTYSADYYSAQNGGQLPWFGAGQGYPADFEETAFSLEEGQISAPIKTRFGWHIVKLIDKKPLESFDELKPQILQSIARSDRNQILVNDYVSLLKKQYRFVLDPKTATELDKAASSVQWNDSLFLANAEKINKPLFFFAGKTYTSEQFVEYSKAKQLTAANIRKNIDNYAASELMSYKNAHLEDEYPEFKNLMREYHDGILFFNLSNEEVWEKSMTDTLGLRQYFEKNKVNYSWNEPRFKGRVLYCKDSKTAKKVRKIIETQPEDSINKHIAALNTNDKILVKVEQKLFVKGENAAVDFDAFKEKNNYAPPAEFSKVFTIGKVLTAPEVYTDVKNIVINDYQEYLEEEWVKNLRKKYSVWIDEEVLNELGEKYKD
jgi:peptidyl-prolyl cis-trans isomerase SurA